MPESFASETEELATPAPAPAPQLAGRDIPLLGERQALAVTLQRTVGNRATTRLVQRGVLEGIKRTLGMEYALTIGTETVLVKSDGDAQQARSIIDSISNTYGIAVDSLKGATATKDAYANAPQAERDKIAARPWRLRELVAVKKALDHYAPILGKARESSARSGTAQEITTLGKVTTSITVNTASGVADPGTLGEFYKSAGAFSIYRSSEGSSPDFPGNVDKQIEATTTHEIAHGLMEYMLDPFMKASGFWLDKNTKSGAADAEAPPTKYANTNATEDLAESVMLYFVDEARLRSSAPKRHGAIKYEVAKWTGAGDFPTPSPRATAAVG
jgi:hypothetical protein